MIPFADIMARYDGVRVAVLGDVMLDRYVFGETSRLAPEAPVPVLRATVEEVTLGGAGNTAYTLAELGGTAELVGVLGQDSAGDKFVSIADRQPRIRLKLLRSPECGTIVKTRFIAGTQQLLRVDVEDTKLIPDRILRSLVKSVRDALKRSDVLILSDHANGVITDAVITETIDTARCLGVPVIVDPKSRNFQRYAGATILAPSAKEAEEATGIECGSDAGAEDAARVISETVGCPHVLVTRGADGLTVLSVRQGERFVEHHPSAACDVINVSGAGDTVVAALALTIGSGASFEIGVQIANVAAGISVGSINFGPECRRRLEQALGTVTSSQTDHKFANLEKAADIARTWQREGKRVVFTNGCFDLIHPGHVRLLQKAKAEGDRLIVALNSDASVRRLKGKGRPIQDQIARSVVMSCVDAVDLVIVFDDDTPMDAITAILPDVIVKGADYAIDQVVGAQFVKSYRGRVTLIPLEEGYSTTQTIQRARGDM
jgi:D-beta-D-heptose 7-phosphate kinase/D-beta-D-heptose 1-phosphate adenosyltransferase